jgi:hypothetical protein
VAAAVASAVGVAVAVGGTAAGVGVAAPQAVTSNAKPAISKSRLRLMCMNVSPFLKY